MKKHKVGDTITLHVIRNRTPMIVSLVLTEKAVIITGKCNYSKKYRKYRSDLGNLHLWSVWLTN